MKNAKHPAFIIGVVSIILFMIGAVVKSQGYRMGDWIVIASVALGGIHWIWSIIDVATRKDLKPFQKRFWLIAVVAAPAIGGMIFYIMHQKAGRLTT
jgi:hypothetical protein